MTMLMKHVIYSTEFDAIQAIICPEETMVAGTYHFALLSGYDTTYDGGKNVQFTLAHDLEAGGQIVMSWPYNQTWIGKNLTVYHAFGTSAIETCVMSEGTGGTDLGAADGTVSILNHTQRARYGSNNYKSANGLIPTTRRTHGRPSRHVFSVLAHIGIGRDLSHILILNLWQSSGKVRTRTEQMKFLTLTVKNRHTLRLISFSLRRRKKSDFLPKAE